MQGVPTEANPTGGTVVAGGATIGPAGSTLTINQSTQNAIINWQQFSIANGETTKFIVPNASAATLNRVFGGNPSLIYGSLQSNGVLYLVNPSGIVVGPSGRIDTAGFLASTLDVSNEQFMKRGDLTFAGTSDASVDNEGVVHASGGDVYIIANQVTNNGTIEAPQGTVGLAAGSDVLFQQAGNQHLFVKATPSGTTRAVGVTNSGAIRAAAAELKAAGGNAYALAINNTGSIAATGFKKVNGQVYLTSDGGNITNSGKISARTSSGNGGTVSMDGTASSGTTKAIVTNSGSIDVAAAVAKGQGGSVLLRSVEGAVVQSGTIAAQGGKGGVGGNVELSAAQLSLPGTVNTSSEDGTTGMLLLDPATFTVAASGGDETGTQVAASLGSTNVTLTGSQAVTIDDAITWTTANTLTLQTQSTGSTIAINSPISGVNGGLTINGAVNGTTVTTGTSGSVDVANFILQNDTTWTQVGNLPAFTASHDFELQNNSTFIRAEAGNGTANAPYAIADIYGLQGLASPTGNLLAAFVDLTADMDASGTATWNGGAGFVPIGGFFGNSSDPANTYQGAFNGEGHVINGLTVNLPGANSGTGLFGDTANGSSIQNLSLTNVHVTGDTYVGGLAGVCNSNVSGVYVSGAVNGSFYVGGLTGISSATISNDYSTASVTGNQSGYSIGGLDGYAQFGTITDCYSSGAVTGGGSGIGGLLGTSGGTVTNSFWDTVTSGQATSAGGTGETTSVLLNQSTYSSAGWSIGQDPTSDTWVILNGQTRPLLAAEYSTTVADAHQLQLIALNATTLAANYTVQGNIDLSGITNAADIWATNTSNAGPGFVPIGNNTNMFSGTFDGGFFTMSGLYILTPSASNVGLFGVASGTIKNTVLSNVEVVGGNDVGGLVGAVGNSASAQPGTGFITGDSVDGTVTGNVYVGGLIGLDHGTSVDTSYSQGTVDGNAFVGGLEGSTLSQLSDVYSTAAVGVTAGPAGGLVGENYYGGTIHNAYSSGPVVANSEVGGLVGRNLGTIDNSFWDITTSGIRSSTGGVGSGTNSGVTAATSSDLESQAFILANAPVSPTWDFTTVWTTNDGTTLPLLQVFASSGGGSSGSGGTGTGGTGTGGTGSGGTGTGGSGTGGSTGGSTPPSTDTGGAADGGSNIVPPVLTPQPTPPANLTSATGSLGNQPPPPAVSFTGSGIAGEGNGGMAGSTGNSSQVGPSDSTEMGNGQVNNVANPAASGALSEALGIAVFHSLADALKSVGDWADADASLPGGGNAGDETETIIGVGDVVEITKKGVKSVPHGQAPPQLIKAMQGFNH